MSITCTHPGISSEELVNGLFVKVTTGPDAGTEGLRVKRISAAAADIEPVVGCAEFNLAGMEIIRRAIGLSDSGKPALILIEET